MTTDAPSSQPESNGAVPVRIRFLGDAGTLTLPMPLPTVDDGGTGSEIRFEPAQDNASTKCERIVLVPAVPGSFTLTF